MCTRSNGPDWTGWAWAGVLAGGDAARLGGSAAGFLHRLLETPPTPIEVLVPRSNARSRPGPWDFVRERPGARSARSVGGPPRITVEDTVLDLAARTTDDRVVIDLVTRAVQQRLTTAPRLFTALQGRSRFRHRRLVTVLLVDVAEGAESALEIAYLRDVEQAHGLPRGRRQVAQSRYRSDVRYGDYNTLVELDGRLGHDGEGRFRDMWRDNTHLLRGQATLRYGWRDVHASPCQVAFQVGGVLAQRGWNGVVGRCPRCRHVIGTDLVA